MLRAAPYASWSSALALAIGVLAGVPASAEDVLPPVTCTVSVGYASAEEGPIHPKFRGIPGNFRSVQMQAERSYTLRFGEQGRYALPSGNEIRMLPVQVHGQRLHMQFEMPGIVNTRLRLRSGKRMVVGGVPFQDGYLIIQVEPSFEAYLPASEPDSPRVINVKGAR